MGEPTGKLFFLPAEGPAVEIFPEAYGPLSYGTPSFEFMRSRIGCDMIEHVGTYYQGKPAHLFADEEGMLKDQPIPNARATALLANYFLRRQAAERALSYNDLTREPPHAQISYAAFRTMIVGHAFLWTGEME